MIRKQDRAITPDSAGAHGHRRRIEGDFRRFRDPVFETRFEILLSEFGCEQNSSADFGFDPARRVAALPDLFGTEIRFPVLD